MRIGRAPPVAPAFHGGSAIPSPAEHALFHTAVWWRKLGASGRGKQLRSGPREISVNWNATRKDAMAADGKRIAVDVQLLSECPLGDGDFLWLGELEDFVDSDTNEIYWVVSKADTVDARGRDPVHKYMLSRFRARLPDAASTGA